LSLYYAEGVAYSSKHPENINNELRNALTHLARALNAQEMDEAQFNMDAASRHIERFKRDCLKVAVVYSGRDLNGLISRAYRRFRGVDPNVTVEASKLVRRRVGAALKEAIGIEQSTPTWEALARDIGKLRERVYDLYPSLDSSNHLIPLWAYQSWDIFKSITGAIGAAVIAGILLMIFFPNAEKSGNAIRHVIAEMIEPAPAANIPSTGAKPGGGTQP